MNDLSHWLDRWPVLRMLVIGDLMLDNYVWGEAESVSPEAPVLVLREDLDEVRPGGAANVASFLRGLDAEVLLAGVVRCGPDLRLQQGSLHARPVAPRHRRRPPSAAVPRRAAARPPAAVPAAVAIHAARICPTP